MHIHQTNICKSKNKNKKVRNPFRGEIVSECVFLHNKSQVPVPPLLGAPRLVEKKEGRGAVRQLKIGMRKKVLRGGVIGSAVSELAVANILSQFIFRAATLCPFDI